MAENLEVRDRLSVRTPMQWSAEAGGGFSTADPERFPAPMPDGRFGPDEVNVADQRRDPDSLLNWFERLIRRRRETPELGLGRWSTIENDVDAVLAHRCDWDGVTVVAVHNFSREPCEVRLRLDDLDDAVALHDLLGSGREELDGSGVTVPLDGYGYRWMRVQRRGQRLQP